jgi:hypothetical protein
MVRGLDRFKEYFVDFQDQYTVIGGTAVFVAMDAAGLAFRVTKDIDIVLCIETIDASFVKGIWAFVDKGDYEYQQKSTGNPRFYRFYKPKDATFPHMLELFSRAPDSVQVPKGCHLTPIPAAEEVSSLSAILLDDDYYNLVRKGCVQEDGLSVLTPEYLVPMKARAYLDLSERRSQGQDISTNDVKKHRNDIIRMSQLISPNTRVALPDKVLEDLAVFVSKGLPDGCNPQDLGIPETSLEDIGNLLSTVYGLQAAEKGESHT